MRKIIEKYPDTIRIVCDKVGCGYEVPKEVIDKYPLVSFIGIQCPDCKEVLLTKDDYNRWMVMDAYINFVNRYFSWLTFFMKKNIKGQFVEAHVHKGIKFTSVDGGTSL